MGRQQMLHVGSSILSFCSSKGVESVGFVLLENSVLVGCPWVFGGSLGLLCASIATQSCHGESFLPYHFHSHLCLHREY